MLYFHLVKLEENIYCLEIFHGPTLAFKDFGARFMSRLISYFNKKETLILVATSGDTGSAVAHGFYNVPGVKVVLLYPSAKVSQIQEQQLTTMGGNIQALEIKGNFDDCQALVKLAITDPDLNKNLCGEYQRFSSRLRTSHAFAPKNLKINSKSF